LVSTATFTQQRVQWISVDERHFGSVLELRGTAARPRLAGQMLGAGSDTAIAARSLMSLELGLS